MSSKPAGTRRPRLLPAALLASGVVVATACTVVAAAPRPSGPRVQTCGPGREWVTVHPAVVIVSDWRPALDTSAPSLAGCVDTRQLAPAGTPSTDSRG